MHKIRDYIAIDGDAIESKDKLNKSPRIPYSLMNYYRLPFRH